MSPLIPYPSDNSRDWSSIIAHYAESPDRPWCAAMEGLACRLRDAGYVASGLHGATSMWDLILGPASDVLNNPHLRISPTLDYAKLTYEDGSKGPWSVKVGFEELCERVERFLVKRARWFRDDSQKQH